MDLEVIDLLADTPACSSDTTTVTKTVASTTTITTGVVVHAKRDVTNRQGIHGEPIKRVQRQLTSGLYAWPGCIEHLHPPPEWTQIQNACQCLFEIKATGIVTVTSIATETVDTVAVTLTTDIS